VSKLVKPWEEHPTIWKTEAAFLSFVRGGIRRSLWNKSPIKLEFLRNNRIKIKNTNARSMKRFPEVWGGVCYECKKIFDIKNMEVDHLTGEYSLRKLEDLQSFVEGIVCVSKKDLGLICKECHKAKTYAERSGMSIDDARIEKQAIAIQKGDDKAWLASQGLTAAKNAKQRREQIIKHLKGE
jgi:hypothetical protein